MPTIFGLNPITYNKSCCIQTPISTISKFIVCSLGMRYTNASIQYIQIYQMLTRDELYLRFWNRENLNNGAYGDMLALLPLVKRQVFCLGDRLKMDKQKAWAGIGIFHWIRPWFSRAHSRVWIFKIFWISLKSAYPISFDVTKDNQMFGCIWKFFKILKKFKSSSECTLKSG